MSAALSLPLPRAPAVRTARRVLPGFKLTLGYTLFYLGLIVLMPLIGHATWHAYRALVEPLPAP